MSVFSFDFTDILGAVIKTSYFFLNIMQKVKAERSGEFFVKNVPILQHHWTWKQLIDIGKNSRNFQKFSVENFRDISKLTTLAGAVTVYCNVCIAESLRHAGRRAL